MSGPAAFRASAGAAPRDLRVDGHRVCPPAAVKPGPIRHGGLPAGKLPPCQPRPADYLQFSALQRRRHVKHRSPGLGDAGSRRRGFSRAVTRWVVPLRLCGTCRLTRCRCLPHLLTSQTALTPPANPPGKPGLHHSRLPGFHGRAMASQAGRFAAPPADPWTCDARRCQRAGTVQVPSVRPAERRRQYRQRNIAPSVLRFSIGTQLRSPAHQQAQQPSSGCQRNSLSQWRCERTTGGL